MEWKGVAMEAPEPSFILPSLSCLRSRSSAHVAEFEARSQNITYMFGAAAALTLAFAPLQLTPHGVASAASSATRCSEHVVMGRKGRPKMPQGGQAGAYASGAQSAMQSPPSDGSTVFYLYCRTEPGKPWYPVSAMKVSSETNGR